MKGTFDELPIAEALLTAQPGASAARAVAEQETGQGARAPLAAFLFLVFTLCLSPDLPPLIYGGLLGGAVVVYIAPYLDKPSALFPLEYLAFLGLIALYVLLSYAGVLPREGFLVRSSTTFTQLKGLLIFCVAYPGFVQASKALLVPTAKVFALGVVAILAFASAFFLRPDDPNVIAGQLYGVHSPAMMLHFAWYLVVTRLTRLRLAQAALLLAPIPLLGASSNVLVQVALALTCVMRGDKRVVVALAILVFAFIGLMAFPPRWAADLASADPNTVLRGRLWHGAISNILTHPLGIGFGTSYSDRVTMGDIFVRMGYSGRLERSFEVANHSSFLDTTLRLSLLGTYFVFLLFWRSWKVLREPGLVATSSAVVAMCLIMSAWNPVLEGARTALFLALATGFLRAAALYEDARDRGPRSFRSKTDTLRSPAERRAQLARQVGVVGT